MGLGKVLLGTTLSSNYSARSVKQSHIPIKEPDGHLQEAVCSPLTPSR